MVSILFVDAYVGSRVTVPEGSGITERNKACFINAEAALLLLRGRVQEQHKTPESEAVEGLPDTADPLQAQAWRQALCLPQVWQVLRCAW